MKRTIGERVGAICGKSSDGSHVLFFGYGSYQGEEIPGPEVFGPLGIKPHDMGLKNPKILLDTGEVVWGCECWWGSEASIRTSVETWNLPLKVITPAEYRATCREASTKSG